MPRTLRTLEGDDDLLRDYTRVRVDGDTLVIDVAVVEWQGPHSPELTWLEATRVAAETGPDAIDKARRQLLSKTRFFVICKECETRHPRGHTDRKICHACMERNHGVIF